ncbi:MAG: isoprenyl transferase [Candidatus Marinimicrobia bacterium]|jgi:undecaprenyl diphosphate synthase|nr:isoprenyl transferase [Candidatus Neomarinimicrobiota bacterium]MBT3575027.1 isoprenyl transferase [Candidatus Neomarinimicrobiota bacterium]MBT3678799.1 isoprenyl transferase [Candidatus Neomarinimicrobiota bacterium]MBT3949913.1 isoprenyl transferase [Candidatus Neomarinimicrobiota bacterium]MBT4252616.1 isoprenyl transferase [Candidatus Neomarinimicrobiota bacterium]
MSAEFDQLKAEVLAHGNLPQHVAIIMDGNGRWAKSKSKPRIFGHKAGVKSVRRITELAGELGLDTLTLYTFSSENWKRPKLEVSALMNLLLDTITKEVDDLHRNNVRLTVIGDLDSMPKGPRSGMLAGIERTSKNTGLNLNLALNYGSRQEILTAVQSIGTDVANGTLEVSEINDNTISNYLYTSSIQDPDLLIRTSGEFRLSNFLLWQLAYTEIFVTPVYWPAFEGKDFLEAIRDYQKRERRYGQVSEQIQH